jgi:alpha-N-acetylglucosaminidase
MCPQVFGYLAGVPRAKLWLLDLIAESHPVWSITASFFGHPFFYCTLLNFGGRQGISGDVPKLWNGFNEALKGTAEMESTSLIGVGITMEGIAITHYFFYSYFYYTELQYYYYKMDVRTVV